MATTVPSYRWRTTRIRLLKRWRDPYIPRQHARTIPAPGHPVSPWALRGGPGNGPQEPASGPEPVPRPAEPPDSKSLPKKAPYPRRGHRRAGNRSPPRGKSASREGTRVKTINVGSSDTSSDAPPSCAAGAWRAPWAAPAQDRTNVGVPPEDDSLRLRGRAALQRPRVFCAGAPPGPRKDGVSPRSGPVRRRDHPAVRGSFEGESLSPPGPRPLGVAGCGGRLMDGQINFKACPEGNMRPLQKERAALESLPADPFRGILASERNVANPVGKSNSKMQNGRF